MEVNGFLKKYDSRLSLAELDGVYLGDKLYALVLEKNDRTYLITMTNKIQLWRIKLVLDSMITLLKAIQNGGEDIV